METTNNHSHNETPSQDSVNRRQFISSVGAVATASSVIAATPISAFALNQRKDEQKKADGSKKPAPESLVNTLYQSFNKKQKEAVCFDWDHKRADGKLLRTYVNNNWQITKPKVATQFFTKQQQEMIEAIFLGLYNPKWHKRILKQIQDDAGGYGKAQSIALFGTPGGEKPFQFAMTGRHLTIRCDGNSTKHPAFGGPIFYGHAADGFHEKANHPGNVFWPQAVKANALYKMLDGKQRKQALVKLMPKERDIHFRKKNAKFTGLPVTELSKDQKTHLQSVLNILIEPYRDADQQEALKCLKLQGGLDKCHITFYQKGDTGNDGVWDNWRLEGPAFVWHFRGAPHVHVWVNIADDPTFKITTPG